MSKRYGASGVLVCCVAICGFQAPTVEAQTQGETVSSGEQSEERRSRYMVPVRSNASRIAYRPEMPVPTGYEIIKRPRMGMLVTGMAVFTASYFGWVSIAAFDDFPPEWFVPLIGKFFATPEFSGTGDSAALAILVLGALAEFAGLTLTILGAVLKRRYLTPKLSIDRHGASVGLRFAF